MSELQKTIASIGMRIGALEGFMEASIDLFGDLLPPAYQDDLRALFLHYQESVDRLQKEIEDEFQ